MSTASVMSAAVYRGSGVIGVEQVPVPELGAGEILIRVEACGICPTDLKKIAYDLLPPPRIYGHETAGVVAAVGSRVTKYEQGDRVIVFHHIPCRACFYCEHKLYAQCAVYKKVGVTAGFEPAGGGFAQYVRVMDWIVEGGVEKIPDGVSFEQASFVEPVNTCLKGMRAVAPRPGEVCAVLGQGPIGLIFTMMGKRERLRVVATDPCKRGASWRYASARRRLSTRAMTASCNTLATSPRAGGLIWYSSRRRPRGLSSKPWPAPALVPASCSSLKPRIRSASRSPARTFAWAKGPYSGRTAQTWISRKSRRILYLAATCRWPI